jgi:hypothetical protein
MEKESCTTGVDAFRDWSVELSSLPSAATTPNFIIGGA